MATPISDASNEFKGSGLANIHGRKTRYQPYGELCILQNKNSPFAHYKCIYTELSCKTTNVECVAFLPFRLSGGLITSVEPQESGYINVATIQNDAWIPIVGRVSSQPKMKRKNSISSGCCGSVCLPNTPREEL